MNPAWVWVLSEGFTPCRHLRPSSGQEHTVVWLIHSGDDDYLMNETRKKPTTRTGCPTNPAWRNRSWTWHILWEVLPWGWRLKRVITSERDDLYWGVTLLSSGNSSQDYTILHKIYRYSAGFPATLEITENQAFRFHKMLETLFYFSWFWNIYTSIFVSCTLCQANNVSWL